MGLDVIMGFTERENHIEKAVEHLLASEKRSELDAYTFYNSISLNWLVRSYVKTILINDMWPDIKKLYSELEEYTEDKPYVWNDLDNEGFIVEHPQNKIIVLTDQNCKFVIIYTDDPTVEINEIHIRQVWFEPEDDEEVKVDLDTAEWVTQFFSDYNHGVYCDRPSLEAYKDIEFDIEGREFPLQYLDQRDKGFILSYNGITRRCEVSLHKYHLLGILGLDIQSALIALNKK